MRQVRLGAIGCGYWGPNLIRNCVEIPSISLEAIVDLDWDRLNHVHARYPGIPLATDDYRELFDSGLDGVIVSTPPETHHDIVTDCLEHGLHVLVEKPLAISSAEARRMVQLAAHHDRILMVGHTFEYNPAVRALKALIDDNELGDIHYIDAVRVGLGLFHPNLNVVWDLAPHDISILIYLLGELPTSVAARGSACLQDSVEDVVYMALTFPSGILAHVRMSWLDPSKTRRITVVGSDKMVVYDDVAPQEKIKLFDKRVDKIRRTDTYGEFQFAYHYGSAVSPYIRFEEPLRVECAHFAECIVDGKTPLTDGVSGLRVVEVIEAAQRSLASGGIPMAVDVDQSIHDTKGRVAATPPTRRIRT
jgi:predicted dehydrogenase